MIYKIIIAGGRDFDFYSLLRVSTLEFISEITDINKDTIEIVSGTAKGADTLGLRFAIEFNHLIKKFPADWNKHGKSAGYKRNKQMANYADACIVFWDGKSKGTSHMIDLAREYALILKVINYN